MNRKQKNQLTKPYMDSNMEETFQRSESIHGPAWWIPNLLWWFFFFCWAQKKQSLWIPIFGIFGSAFATLLSITLYSLAKLLFVVKKLNLYPFTKETISSMVLTFVLFLVFYFWEFPFFQLISIALKSILVTILYVYLNYRFNISPDINKVIDTLLRKIGIKI